MRWFFLRNKIGHPVACVATVLSDAKDQVTYTVSCHNTRDLFNRALARNIATLRIKKNHHAYTIAITDASRGLMKAVLLDQVIHNYDTDEDGNLVISQAAREAAKLWLKGYWTLESQIDRLRNRRNKLEEQIVGISQALERLNRKVTVRTQAKTK